MSNIKPVYCDLVSAHLSIVVVYLGGLVLSGFDSTENDSVWLNLCLIFVTHYRVVCVTISLIKLDITRAKFVSLGH